MIDLLILAEWYLAVEQWETVKNTGVTSELVTSDRPSEVNMIVKREMVEMFRVTGSQEYFTWDRASGNMASPKPL